MQNLVVVESPSKIATIDRYLNDSGSANYHILATSGHVYEIERKDGQVDVDNDFQVKYHIAASKKKNVDRIVSAMEKSDALYLATDLDREGEAISAHVFKILESKNALRDKPVYRIKFNEITRDALLAALEAPTELSSELVDAQHARAALDYLVGFNLSPLLWRRVSSNKLSAGRVQSPALRIIVERQREIDRFKPQEYWSIEAAIAGDSPFKAALTHLDGDKIDKYGLKNESQVNEAVDAIQQSLERSNAARRELVVKRVKRSERKNKPGPPFTTSTLMQAASRSLNMSTDNVMRVAQQLYEGVNINGTQTALITYLRTDSVSLSDAAVKQLRRYIGATFGNDQMPDAPRRYKSKSRNAQEAHEAIRPTDVFLTPEEVKSSLHPMQHQLYDLIWKRAVACQMNHATYDQVGVDLGVEEHVFHVAGSTLRDPGYLAVYGKGNTFENAPDSDAPPPERQDRALPPLTEGERVEVSEIVPQQHFTQPPARYNYASLVKQLEEYGIGRPSTYAPTIKKLEDRGYIELSKRNFIATHLGCVVNDFLIKHFEQYVDYEFSANLDDGLDQIARGDQKRVEFLNDFWRPFEKLVEEKLASTSRYRRELGTDPKMNRNVYVCYGKFGAYLQIGEREDDQEREFRNLPTDLDPGTVTLDDVESILATEALPKTIEGMPEGYEVIAKSGRYGNYIAVKIGDEEGFNVSLNDIDPHAVTPEQVMDLIENRKRGNVITEFEDGKIRVLKGRYGPYVTDGSTNASIPKNMDPEQIDLETCKRLIEDRKAGGKFKKRVIQEFDDGIQVLAGRYGPYATDGKTNATIPQGVDPETIDVDDCRKLIAARAAKGKSGPRRRRS